MLTLATDDNKEQTRRVMIAAAMAEELQEGEPDFAEWHQFDAALDAAVHEVTIPYRAWLAANIPPAAVRMRRDFPTLLELIRTHAMIYQLQREKDGRGWVVAAEADYKAVQELVKDLMSDQMGKSVSKAVREIVAAVERIDAGQGVTVTILTEALNVDHTTAYRRARAAEKRGYLLNIEADSGRGKRPARYKVGDPLPSDVVLLPNLPGPDVWSACTFDDLAEYFEDDEAAGQEPEDGKSANMQPVVGDKSETSERKAPALFGAHFGATPLCPDCGDPEDSHWHAIKRLGEDPAA